MSYRPEHLVVIGAGGFGRETVDVLRACAESRSGLPYELLGVIDSRPTESNLTLLSLMGVNYLGTEEAWLQRKQMTSYLVGVGNPSARREISQRFDKSGNVPGYAVHPQAIFGSLTLKAPGLVVCAGVQVSTNVSFGCHVHLNPNSTIGHDTSLGDFVSINPGAIVSGNVDVQEYALVGAGAVILQGLKVGSKSVVGASACVTRDVMSQTVVKGVPAR